MIDAVGMTLSKLRFTVVAGETFPTASRAKILMARAPRVLAGITVDKLAAHVTQPATSDALTDSPIKSSVIPVQDPLKETVVLFVLAALVRAKVGAPGAVESIVNAVEVMVCVFPAWSVATILTIASATSAAGRVNESAMPVGTKSFTFANDEPP